MIDSFLTIKSPSKGLFKDKGSKFIAFAYPVSNEDEIKKHIQYLKKEHDAARHHCYAWRLGVEKIRFRVNDDGEPSSSAGKPILGQIQKFDLTNILIVVVRYFGGKLLGVGGLINAYRTATINALEKADILEEQVKTHFWVEYEYPLMNEVMKIFKDHKLPQLQTEFEMHCRIKSAVRLNESEHLIKSLCNIPGVIVKPVDK